jgi:hypothetical protein
VKVLKNTLTAVLILLAVFVTYEAFFVDNTPLNYFSPKSASSTVYVENGVSGVVTITDPSLHKTVGFNISFYPLETGSGVIVSKNGYIITAFHVGDYPGEVVIQSYNPENPVIQMAAQQDYFKFYQEEIKFRKLLHYPPFTNLLRVVINSDNEPEARQVCSEMAEYINEIIDAREEDIQILGPAPCPISKIRNRYRYQVLVKCDNLLLICSIAQYIIYRGNNNTRIEIDINPLMTM